MNSCYINDYIARRKESVVWIALLDLKVPLIAESGANSLVGLTRNEVTRNKISIVACLSYIERNGLHVLLA